MKQAVPRWRTVPSLIHIAHELVPSDQEVAQAAGVLNHGPELTRPVQEVQLTVHDVRRHTALKI